METALVIENPENIDETYKAVRPHIEQTVQQFYYKYRQFERSLDELMADANLYFMKAWQDYSGGNRGGHKNFVTGVKRWVWFELFDAYRTQRGYRRQDRARSITTDFQKHPPVDKGWTVDGFCQMLGEDAEVVVQLLFETPLEIADIANGKGGYPTNWRSTLRDYLHGIGWSRRRVNNSFTEIAQALLGG